MSKGAEISAPNHYGDTPMHYACLFGKLDIVQVILAGLVVSQALHNC